MNGKRRLLILSCSQRKRASHDPLPAIDRYNGPLFFVLRRFLRERPRQASLLDVYILSAAYGLIPGDFSTTLYDRKMNTSRIAELQPQIATAFSGIRRDDYISVCFVLGKAYLKALEGLQAHKEAIVAYGPMGKRQTQLKKWLWGEDSYALDERNLDETGNY